MIDKLVGSLDGMLNFILQKIIYPFILFLEKKRNYVIPPDTTRDSVVREHTLLNLIAMAADVICAILILVGLNDRIVTYAGLMAIAMCILADQGKIYGDQYKQLASGINVCLIKGKEWKVFKRYTPSLGRVIISGIFIVIFLVLALFSIFQSNLDLSSGVYNFAMPVMLVIMVGIKLKYYFMSTFVLKDCIIKEKKEV